jgi:ankyrin repeat protein
MYIYIYVYTPVIIAVRKRYFDIVRLLVETGMYIHMIMNICIYIYTYIYIYPYLYIYVYVCIGHCDVNIHGYSSMTALMWAVYNNDDKIVYYLLRNGAQINDRDEVHILKYACLLCIYVEIIIILHMDIYACLII